MKKERDFAMCKTNAIIQKSKNVAKELRNGSLMTV